MDYHDIIAGFHKLDRDDRDKALTAILETYVNSCGHKGKVIPTAVYCWHRHLQSEFFDLMQGVITMMAKECEDGDYDDRNKYAVECSKQIKDTLGWV